MNTFKCFLNFWPWELNLQFHQVMFMPHSQLNFPARISVKYGCAVLSFSKVCTENMLLSFPAHFSARFCFAPVTNQKLQNAALCAKKKNCSNKYTNTDVHEHTCSRMLLMSLGKTIVPSKVVRRLTCWQRKWFPSGLNTEERLCCQSPMPAKLLRSLHSQYQHEHLLQHTSTMRLRSTRARSGTGTTNPGTKAYFWGKKLRERNQSNPINYCGMCWQCCIKVRAPLKQRDINYG